MDRNTYHVDTVTSYYLCPAESGRYSTIGRIVVQPVCRWSQQVVLVEASVERRLCCLDWAASSSHMPCQSSTSQSTGNQLLLRSARSLQQCPSTTVASTSSAVLPRTSSNAWPWPYLDLEIWSWTVTLFLLTPGTSPSAQDAQTQPRADCRCSSSHHHPRHRRCCDRRHLGPAADSSSSSQRWTSWWVTPRTDSVPASPHHGINHTFHSALQASSAVTSAVKFVFSSSQCRLVKERWLFSWTVRFLKENLNYWRTLNETVTF